MFESILVNDLKKLNNIKIIDIRSIEKYNDNHIMNAINVPANQLLTNTSKYLNRFDKYYIYCQKGIQSSKICKVLKNNGYDVVNISGGYESWVMNE